MHKTKKRRNHSDTESNKSPVSFMKKYVLLCILFFGISILLALLLSSFFYNTENPTAKIRLISLISIYVSSFLCGIILSKTVENKNLIYGTIYGLIIFLIVFSISLFLKNDQHSVLYHVFLPIASAIGAICGKKREKKHKHRRY